MYLPPLAVHGYIMSPATLIVGCNSSGISFDGARPRSSRYIVQHLNANLFESPVKSFVLKQRHGLATW